MSRPRATEPYVQQKVSLPSTLMARFSLLHWDPVLNKPKYAAISSVITALLTDYVSKMEGGENPLAGHEIRAARAPEPAIKDL